MQRLEFMLQVLTAQGVSTAAAMTYAALIDRHIFGSGLQEAEEARMSRRHGLDDEASLAAAMGAVHDLAACMWSRNPVTVARSTIVKVTFSTATW